MNGGLRLLIVSGSACVFCALCALLTATAEAADNRWTAIGPDGANVVALVADQHGPAIAYAGTLVSGVLKTTNGGMTWATANQGLPTLAVSALAMDPATPSTLYAGTDAGVFKSIDGGGNWSEANAGFGSAMPVTISSIAIDPHASNTLYAVTAAGLFKSVNGAANWVTTFSMPPLTPRIIVIDPAVSSTIYVACDDNINYVGGGVFKSVDSGSTWTRVLVGPSSEDGQYPITALAIDSSASSRLYLVSATGIVQSTDGGATWTGLPAPGGYPYSLAVDASSPGTIYASTIDGSVFRTIDAGGHWSLVSNGPLVPVAIIALTRAAPNMIYVGGFTGIYLSLDHAQTWTRRPLGVRSSGVYAVASDPASPSTIYASSNGNVLKTSDGGGHWFRPIDGPDLQWVGSILFDPAAPSTVYVGGSARGGCGDEDCPSLYKSVDSGAHWTELFTRTHSVDVLAIAPSRGSTLYAGQSYGSVMKSLDGGATWATANNGLASPRGIWVSALGIDPTNADTVYVATSPPGSLSSDAKLFKSTDGAAQWHQTPLVVAHLASITSLAIDASSPATIYAGYAFGGAGEGGVFKSLDGGQTWAKAQSGMPDTAWVWALAIDPSAPNRVFAATREGVFMTSDAAANWTSISAGLPDLDILSISIDRTGSHLRVASGAGLFEYGVSSPPPSTTLPVIEYVHAEFGHYFITANPDEVGALDKGIFPGWARTGFQFNADTVPGPQSAPVCRFFTTAFGPKSSHFYSPFGFECAITKTDPHWSLESAAAFYIPVPAFDGTCAAGLLPVYRLYNNFQGGAPNHRYTTDLTERARMVAQGWVPEGRGPDAVQMCSPQ